MAYATLVSLLVTLIASTILLTSKATKNIKDVPNERSLHQVPTPRIGGAGMMVGMLAGWAVVFHFPSPWIFLPLLSLFILSLVDDIRGLSVRFRFALHLVAASSVVWGEGLFAVNMLVSFMAVLIIVWVINLYNFMDGSDGLAGGMALFGFSIYGIAALMGGEDRLAMMCFSVAAAALGFLYFNFPPAKIFMGDAGSVPLGFLAAAIGFSGWNKGVWPIWFPVMVFSPFVLDATVTLIKRAVRGARVWQAHREHYYQRLVQLGAGHRTAALIEYTLILSVGISALWALHNPNILFGILLAWFLIYGVAMIYVDYRWRGIKRA